MKESSKGTGSTGNNQLGHTSKKEKGEERKTTWKVRVEEKRFAELNDETIKKIERGEKIINKEETAFILVKAGWFKKEFTHGVVFHFEIKNDKVWLYQNSTDIDIGINLVEQGIPKSDIVLAFVSKLERTSEGYALA